MGLVVTNYQSHFKRIQMEKLLEIQHLRTCFQTKQGDKYAVDDVSFDVIPKETLCIVGESGCGKSVTALSIMGLLPKRIARVAGGKILFCGEDLLNKTNSEMQAIRGNRISMIFQEPMTSLNPVYTNGFQIIESIRLHQKISKQAAYNSALEMLRKVGISSPEQRMKEYPFQLSGGMRQRVMIAMALSCNASLLIADEPTTALDVTIQAQILDLLRSLKEELGTSIILITHDLGVVAEMADRVMVMYAGQIMEMAKTQELFDMPLHPYTQGLLKSLPRLDIVKDELYMIPGMVPDLMDIQEGCRFYQRCDARMPICSKKTPELFKKDGRLVRCWQHIED